MSGQPDHERLLAELRPSAFAVAYRMLGEASDADEIAQEALLRLHRAMGSGEVITSPRALLTTITTRLAINALRSARARRECYVGAWLPEPIITGDPDDPALHSELAESLSMSMLVLLGSLTPEQRAVLLLHDVFDYAYEEIASMLGKTEPAVRQLATRARRHAGERRPRFQTTREQREELTRRFFAAIDRGDLSGLEALLASDVQFAADGGGKAPALDRPVRGRVRVARTLILFAERRAARPWRIRIRPVDLNGGPGAVYLDSRQRVLAAVSLEIASGQITSINSIVNPDKLIHLQRN